MTTKKELRALLAQTDTERYELARENANLIAKIDAQAKIIREHARVHTDNLVEISSLKATVKSCHFLLVWIANMLNMSIIEQGTHSDRNALSRDIIRKIITQVPQSVRRSYTHVP